MAGPYVSRSTRAFRFLLLFLCVLLGAIGFIGGLAIIFLVRSTLAGLLVIGVSIGLIAVAFRKRDQWHPVHRRLDFSRRLR